MFLDFSCVLSESYLQEWPEIQVIFWKHPPVQSLQSQFSYSHTLFVNAGILKSALREIQSTIKLILQAC